MTEVVEENEVIDEVTEIVASVDQAQEMNLGTEAIDVAMTENLILETEANEDVRMEIQNQDDQILIRIFQFLDDQDDRVKRIC